MSNIHIEDLNAEITLSDEEVDHVRGGILIGLLLPAVQK